MAWIWNNEKVKVINLKTLPKKHELNNIEIINELLGKQEKFIFLTNRKVEFVKMKNGKACFNSKGNKLYYPDTGRTKSYDKRIIFESLKMLVDKECNIIMNYNIFNFWNPKYKEILESKGYVLVLENLLEDEHDIGVTKYDIDILFNNDFIYLDEDNKVYWNDKNSYNGLAFLDDKHRIKNTNVYFKDELFFTKFEKKFFEKWFNNVYIVKNKI